MKLKRIYHRLWQLYISSMLLPLLILAFTLTIIISNRVINDTMIKNKNTLNTLSYNIESLLEEMKQCSIQWVNIPNILNFYKKVNSNDGIIPSQPVHLEKEYNITLGNVLVNSNSLISSIDFYPLNNSEKHIYVATRYNQLLDYNNYHINDLQYKKVINEWGTPFLCAPSFEPYADGNQEYFSLIRLSFDVDKHSPYGIVKVDASTEYFNSLFSNLELRENSGILIFDTDGSFIYTTDDSLSKYLSISNGTLAATNNKYVIQEKQIGNYSWNIAYCTSKMDLLEEAKLIILISAVVGILALFVSFFLFSRKSRGLTKPLDDILSAMHQSETGNLSSKISITADMPSEFESIALEYNKLLDTLTRYIELEYQAKIDYQKAEFKALQSQINPHFLYNTLNNFVTLNRLGLHQKLEDSIMALTEMFRYSSAKVQDSSVISELSFVEKYLSLQQIRYGNRLEYTISMAPETAEYLIPRLLIQPVVENSVIHGIEPIERTVHISISSSISYSETPSLVFTIEDNGAGKTYHLSEQTEQNHTALKNIQDRLKLISPDTTFSFILKPDSGAVTVISIPINKLRKKL